MGIQQLRDSIQHSFRASARQIKEAIAEVDELEQRLANMRAALEQVEWIYEDGGECPWCRAKIVHGHKSDCARQKALGY